MKTFVLATAVALAACHSGGSSAPLPVIDSFTADIEPLPAGATETLRWTVRNATTLTISPGVGDVTGKTSATVNPTALTTYTLTAANKDHPTGVAQSVTVTIAAGASIVYFTAVPSQVVAGTPVTYSWSVKNASAVLFDNAPVTGNSVVQNATVTATHTLSVTGTPGSTPPPPAQAVVRVVSSPTISSFSVSPSTPIPQGSTAVLSWTGNGLGYSLSDGAHDTNVGGQTHATVSPAATTTYTLTARGPAGTSATRSQVVSVTLAGGSRTLSYVDPVTIPAGAVLALKQATSPPGKVVLNLVTTQDVSGANALAFGLALDGSKVALDAPSGGDISPGFTVSAALDPGTAPPAAKASLRTDGPLANVLILGIARKPSGSGAAPGDAPIASGTIVCTIRLVPAANAGPGQVFPLAVDAANPSSADAYKPYKAVLRGASSSSTQVAIGTLTMN